MTVLSYPLAREEFMDRLLINRIKFDCPDQNAISGLGSGGVILAEARPRLWEGEISLTQKGFGIANEMAALIRLLLAPGASFLAYDVRHLWPASDPNGVRVSASNPKLAAVSEDNNQVVFSGLPSHYELGISDRFCFSYEDAAGNSLIALHEVVTRHVQANAGGLTSFFQVQPPIREGFVDGADVELVKPYCKAIIVPKSATPGEGRKTGTSGIGFKFIQQLR